MAETFSLPAEWKTMMADSQRFGHGVQMRRHVNLKNGEYLSILSKVFRIFGLDELVDLKVAE